MRDTALSRIALGTVQFGMVYGIANAAGKQVSRDEAAEILRYAHRAGIRALDTAAAYGESETVLGEIGVSDWSITSKLPAMPEGADPESWVTSSAEQSIRRLGVRKLHAMLLHNPAQLLDANGERLYRALARLKEQNLVSRIGVSVIRAEDARNLFARFGLEVFQSAMNVFDRRLATSGALDVLKHGGAEVQIRSIFLQGLLLMAPESRPEKFRRFASVWSGWDNWLGQQGMSALSACLAFALQIPGADRIVLGVDSLGHLKEIIAAVPSHTLDIPASLASADEALLDPWRWVEL